MRPAATTVSVSLRGRTLALAAAALLGAAAAPAQVTVYDDALANGFQNWSWGGGSNFASTGAAHGGTFSVALDGNAWNAVAFANPGQDFSTAQYPRLHFWVHGGASGNQQLYLYLQLDNVVVVQRALDDFIAGGALVAGEWREVTVDLTAPPLSYAGSYDRIDLQSDSPGTQPRLYVDDVTLEPAAPTQNVIRTEDWESGRITGWCTHLGCEQPAVGAVLAASKTVAGSFAEGGTVTYTLVLTNSGDGAQADNAGDELTDVLPAGVALTGANADGGTVAQPGGNTVTWNGSLAPAASVTVTITAVVQAGTAGSTVINQGALAYDSDGDQDNDAAATTDDPGLPGAADPTAFIVPGNTAPLAVTSGVTNVGGQNLPSRTFAWIDAAGTPRQALMIDQRNSGVVGAGYLRRMTYRVGGIDRVCNGIASGFGIQGMGYVENHTGLGPDNWTVDTPGTTTVVLAGRHHAIVEYAMPTHQLDGKTIPTYVQWYFATGRSHPIFAVGQDATAHPNLGADSRSPYGSVDFACNGAGTAVGGVSWGDTYKFVSVVNGTTAESTALSSNSGWRYNQANSIPYVLAWASGVDAEEGTVATSPIFFQDQGSDPRTFPLTGFGKNQQDLDGPMPSADDWAYQLMNYGLGPGGTTDKKMAWGTNFGALGGFDNYSGLPDTTNYSRHWDSTTPFTGTRVNGQKLGFSTFVVFGTHAGGYTGGTTGRVVGEMESNALATLTTTVGTVKTSGPRGVGPSLGGTNVTWSPAGYNHVYATWEVVAAGNAADLVLAASPAAGPLVNPVFVVNGYTGAVPPATVALDGAPAAADGDYFASVDAAHQKLWITVNRTVAAGGSVRLQVTP